MWSNYYSYYAYFCVTIIIFLNLETYFKTPGSSIKKNLCNNIIVSELCFAKYYLFYFVSFQNVVLCFYDNSLIL